MVYRIETNEPGKNTGRKASLEENIAVTIGANTIGVRLGRRKQTDQSLGHLFLDFKSDPLRNKLGMSRKTVIRISTRRADVVVFAKPLWIPTA